MSPTAPRRARGRLASALAALIVLATLAACASGDADTPDASWQTVRDTVGDTLVVRTVGAGDEAALLTLVPELQVGELDGEDEYQFAQVAFVLPAPGNGVYVWDGSLKALRHYDSTGTFVRQIGRKGGGPGEYEESNGFVLLPDGRLAMWDPRNMRITLFDSAGAATASFRHQSGLFVGGSSGLLGDTLGRLYALHWFRVSEREALPGENTGYMVLDTTGAVRDSVFPPRADVPAANLVASSKGGTSMNSVPFAPSRTWAFSPHGYFVWAVSDRYAVTLARPEGPLRIERDVARVPVDADERANHEEQITANMRRMDPNWRWNGPTIPDTKPFVRNLTVAADGRLWVGRHQPAVRVEPDTSGGPRDPGAPPPSRWREPMAYDVFEPDGRFLGHLRVPERTTLLYMRGDHAWGTQRDSLDVPTVIRFRVQPPLAERAAIRTAVTSDE